MRKTNQKGFTIIELLVVIVIIGILVALALPQLFAAQERGRDTDRKNDLKNVQQKLETYFNDEDEYPTAVNATDGFAAANIEPEDMQGPRDSTYTYTCVPADADPCQAYTLSAELENEGDKDAESEGEFEGFYVLRSVNQPEDEE